ncbi:MAG: two-component regulator propeller domain-containing protein [Ignavibacteriota bacterium]
MTADRDGNFWVATHGERSFSRERPGSGQLRRAPWAGDEPVWSMFEDREGSLWVGTASGLERLRDTRLLTISHRQGLPSDAAENLIVARDGSVYVFCAGGGLVQIRDGALKAYTRTDGLAGLYSNGMFESRDGSIWLGASSGTDAVPKRSLRYLHGQRPPVPIFLVGDRGRTPRGSL